MKTKKCGVYAALAAVLLISAVLLFGCEELTGGLYTEPSGVKTFTPPPGKAAIQIILPGEAARTLLPVAPTTVFYDVHIQPSVGETGTSYGNAEKDGGGVPAGGANLWIVAAGKYDITVFAYTNATFTGSPFAAFQEIDKTISGTTASSAAVMAAIVDNDATGTFDYAVTLPTTTTPTTATLSLTPVGTGTAIGPLDISTTSAGTPTVKSGYYRLAVKLEKAKYVTVTYSHIVHIYGGQTTEYKGAKATLDEMTRISWDVTINANGGTLGGGGATYDNSGNGWYSGGLVTAISGTYVPTAPTANPTYVVGSWHTAAAGTEGNEWVFATEKIFADTTLYPQYIDPTVGTNLTITITAYDDPVEGTFGFGGSSTATVGWTEDGTGTVNVTATPAGGTWRTGSGISLGTTTLTDTAINTYNTTAPDNEKINLSAPGAWYELSYEVGAGATLRSAPFSIRIGPQTP